MTMEIKSSWIFDQKHASIWWNFNQKISFNLETVMKHISLLFVLIFTCPIWALTDTILIITHAFNRPDFIEYQAKTFKKFLKDPYEFVVFNDANSGPISEQIREICKKMEIRCVEIPRIIQKGVLWASLRTANSIEYSLKHSGFDHDGIVFIIDSDMFLIKPLHIKEFLGDYDLYGERQSRDEIVYLWNGLLFMNMATLPNKRTMSFSPAPIKGKALDTGGHLHYYLTNNPSIKLKTYGDTHINLLPKDKKQLLALGFDAITSNFIINYDQADSHCMQFHADDHFLHYRGGGNWMHKEDDYHAKKSEYLFKYLDAITTPTDEAAHTQIEQSVAP